MGIRRPLSTLAALAALAALVVVGAGLAGCTPAFRGSSPVAPPGFPDRATVTTTGRRVCLQWRSGDTGQVLFTGTFESPCAGRGTEPPGALALPGATGTDVAVAFQPGVGAPLQLRMHRRDGTLRWQRSLPNSSLIGAADVLGTGRADLIVASGTDLRVLDENTGVTVLDVGLPPAISAIGLAPSLRPGGRAASIVLISDPFEPSRQRDDVVTALSGPVLAPLWQDDVHAYYDYLSCCDFGRGTEPAATTGPAPPYVPDQDPARDLTGDGVADLFLGFAHGGLLMLDGATGQVVLGGGGAPPSTDVFLVRAARAGQRGLVAFTVS